ncbi:slipin family protein [Streptomyces sp. NPDC059398]|uniref:slipin family protein n=1 Tax=Streptomyces sp. NPDC059398 TaxID=3346820 RepID=UPI003694E512
MEVLVAVIVVIVCLAAVYGLSAARVVKQFERGVVLRFGRLREAERLPGFTTVIPGVDRLHKVNLQIVTMPVPAQEGITRDNVTVRVDAVVYFKVVNAADAVIAVEDYRFAVSQMAQTSLRSIIGKSDLDDLLSNREKLNQGLELMIDSPAIGWGVQIDRVEIKDVSLPETMKRSMARQAEAARERRARVINADAELQASKKLAQAAEVMSKHPAALQLRLLQTVAEVASEKNSTLVLPFPVELLRFLERAQRFQQAPGADAADGATTDTGEAPAETSDTPVADAVEAAVPGLSADEVEAAKVDLSSLGIPLPGLEALEQSRRPDSAPPGTGRAESEGGTGSDIEDGPPVPDDDLSGPQPRDQDLGPGTGEETER